MLLDKSGIQKTKEAIQEIVIAKINSSIPSLDTLTTAQKEEINDTKKKLAIAISEIIEPICQHIIDNAEIGTITTDAPATQTNAGEGLII